jgi:hypothetical protein
MDTFVLIEYLGAVKSKLVKIAVARVVSTTVQTERWEAFFEAIIYSHTLDIDTRGLSFDMIYLPPVSSSKLEIFDGVEVECPVRSALERV